MKEQVVTQLNKSKLDGLFMVNSDNSHSGKLNIPSRFSGYIVTLQTIYIAMTRV